jgi:hypothetical protein
LIGATVVGVGITVNGKPDRFKSICCSCIGEVSWFDLEASTCILPIFAELQGKGA